MTRALCEGYFGERKCYRPKRSAKYCPTHYKREQLGQPINAIHRKDKTPSMCYAYFGHIKCIKDAAAHGLCKTHLQRVARGKPLDDPKNARRTV